MRKPLAAWQGFLIAIGLLLAIICLAYYGGEPVQPFLGVTLLGTVVWACIDSYRIRNLYGTKDTTAHPLALMFMLVGLWIVIFPMYLVTRSRVLATGGGTSPGFVAAVPVGSGQVEQSARSGRTVLAIVISGLCVVVIGVWWFFFAGGDIHGIWAKTEANLAAANTAVPSTPQTSTVAAASTPTETAVDKRESAQQAQPEATAAVRQSALGVIDLQSCISGGKPESACLSEELDRQDARLNKEYQRVMAQYKQLGQADNTAALRRVEVEWINRVKTECDTTPPGFIGNPDRRRIECRLDMTKSRADELAKMQP